jgi:hypothetical protein
MSQNLLLPLATQKPYKILTLKTKTFNKYTAPPTPIIPPYNENGKIGRNSDESVCAERSNGFV